MIKYCLRAVDPHGEGYRWPFSVTPEWEWDHVAKFLYERNVGRVLGNAKWYIEKLIQDPRVDETSAIHGKWERICEYNYPRSDTADSATDRPGSMAVGDKSEGV